MSRSRPSVASEGSNVNRRRSTAFFPLPVPSLLEPAVADLSGKLLRVLLYLLALAYRREDCYYGCLRRKGRGPYTQRELATLMQRSEGFLSHALTQLREAGLIERVTVNAARYIQIGDFGRWHWGTGYPRANAIIEERLAQGATDLANEQESLPLRQGAFPLGQDTHSAELAPKQGGGSNGVGQAAHNEAAISPSAREREKESSANSIPAATPPETLVETNIRDSSLETLARRLTALFPPESRHSNSQERAFQSIRRLHEEGASNEDIAAAIEMLPEFAQAHGGRVTSPRYLEAVWGPIQRRRAFETPSQAARDTETIGPAYHQPFEPLVRDGNEEEPLWTEWRGLAGGDVDPQLLGEERQRAIDEAAKRRYREAMGCFAEDNEPTETGGEG